jgi:hypothetical protein
MKTKPLKTLLVILSLVLTAFAVAFAGAGNRPMPSEGGRLGAGADVRQSPFVLGKVTAVSPKTITVEISGMTRVVNVTEKTKFIKQTEGKTSDIKKGMWAQATGVTSTDGKTIEARFIAVNPPRPEGLNRQRPDNATSGELVSASSLIVKTADGKSVTVVLKKGAKVAVIGKESGDGKTIEARGMTILPSQSDRVVERRVRGFAMGEVTKTSPLTMKSYDNRSVIVKTTAETRISITKNVTLAEVKKDDYVMVNGHPGANGALEAVMVRIQNEPDRRLGGVGSHPGVMSLPPPRIVDR